MAIRYVCDRCHDYRDEENFLRPVTFPGAGVNFTPITVQVCDKCVRHLRDEAAPLPTRAEAPK